MVKRLLLFLILFTSISHVSAKDDVVGWHWYNEPLTPKKEKKHADHLMRAFQHLSPSKQLKVLQMATNNLLDRAILTGKVSDITAFKEAQDFWVGKSTRFTVGWEIMLLAHPKLNYALSHPHENAYAPIMERSKSDREEKAIAKLSQKNGLLFFYRGKNKGDVRFSKTIQQFSKAHQFVLISVSVDGVASPLFQKSRADFGLEKAHALGIHYFPALVLVNPSTSQHSVVSYGFKSEEELSDRFLKIEDGWQPEF